MAAAPSSRKAIGTRGNSAAIRILLLVAFLVQSIFVQAHVHAAPLAVPAGIAATESPAGPADDPSQHGPGDASSHCFQCWQAAVAGQFLLPSAEFTLPTQQPAAWEPPQLAAEFALGKVSHGWLGRGPPQ